MTQKQTISPISDEQIKARAQANAEVIARRELEAERQQAIALVQQQQAQEQAAQEQLQAAALAAFDSMEIEYARRDELAAQLAPMLKELAAFTIDLELRRRKTIEDMGQAGVNMDRLSNAVAHHRMPFVSKLPDVDRDAAAWAATFVSGVVSGLIAWGDDDQGRVTSIIGPSNHQTVGRPLG